MLDRQSKYSPNYMDLEKRGSVKVGDFQCKKQPHSSRARVGKIQLILEITVIKIGKYLYDVYPFP